MSIATIDSLSLEIGELHIGEFCIGGSCDGVLQWKIDSCDYANVTTQSDTDGFKYSCRYCGGYTKDDSRGNCSACGAPR